MRILCTNSREFDFTNLRRIETLFVIITKDNNNNYPQKDGK